MISDDWDAQELLTICGTRLSVPSGYDSRAMSAPSFRNVALIAHVDHGKTTLVDAMLSSTGVFASHEATVDRVMDSTDQERERGITILAKAASVTWKGTRINLEATNPIRPLQGPGAPPPCRRRGEQGGPPRRENRRGRG